MLFISYDEGTEPALLAIGLPILDIGVNRSLFLHLARLF